MTGQVVSVPEGAKSITVEAVVIRADGTQEDLGTVAYWHKNPLKRLAFRIKSRLGK